MMNITKRKRTGCSAVENEGLLVKLLSAPSGCISHVHCYGPSSSGVKETFISVREKLSSNQIKMIVVNSISIEGSSRRLHNEIARGFEICDTKIENIDSLHSAIDDKLRIGTVKKLVVVLLEAQALAAFTSSFLVAFFDMARMIEGGRLSFATCSVLPWSMFQREQDSSAAEPLSIAFRKPTEAECISKIEKILSIPTSFITICVGHLIPHTSDPSVLLNLIREAWSQTTTELCTTVSGLKSTIEFLDYKVESRNLWFIDSACSLLTPSARLLLVASFFASHNNPFTDKRYFIKCHGKEKVRLTSKQTLNDNGSPRAFDIERLLFIRAALMELYPNLKENTTEEEVDTRIIIGSLVNMNSLSLCSSTSNLDWPRFKCAAPYEVIRELARSIDITDIDIHIDH